MEACILPPLVDGFADSRDLAQVFKAPHGPLLDVIAVMRGEFAQAGHDGHFRNRHQTIGGDAVHSVLLSKDAVLMLFKVVDRVALLLGGTGGVH